MANVAENIVKTLHANGIDRVYGIPGDSLNGFTDALRKDGTWKRRSHDKRGRPLEDIQTTLMAEASARVVGR